MRAAGRRLRFAARLVISFHKQQSTGGNVNGTLGGSRVGLTGHQQQAEDCRKSSHCALHASATRDLLLHSAALGRNKASVPLLPPFCSLLRIQCGLPSSCQLRGSNKIGTSSWHQQHLALWPGGVQQTIMLLSRALPQASAQAALQPRAVAAAGPRRQPQPPGCQLVAPLHHAL